MPATMEHSRPPDLVDPSQGRQGRHDSISTLDAAFGTTQISSRRPTCLSTYVYHQHLLLPIRPSPLYQSSWVRGSFAKNSIPQGQARVPYHAQAENKKESVTTSCVNISSSSPGRHSAYTRDLDRAGGVEIIGPLRMLLDLGAADAVQSSRWWVW